MVREGRSGFRNHTSFCFRLNGVRKSNLQCKCCMIINKTINKDSFKPAYPYEDEINML